MAITNISSLDSTITLPDSTTREVTTESNSVSIENLSEDFSKVKSSSTSYAIAGEEVTQTITLTNNSDYEISNLTIKDTPSAGATFKAGSVTVNGTAYENYDIVTGFEPTQTISANGGQMVITYVMTVDSDPTDSSVTNTATISYEADGETFSEQTNTVEIKLVSNDVEVVKSASQNVAVSGDSITFTIVITNNGTLENTDLTFTDPIPSGLTFTSGSVTVDGTQQSSYNPTTGFALDNLAAGASTTVTFEVTVD